MRGEVEWGEEGATLHCFQPPPVEGRKKGGLGRGEEVNYKAIVAYYIRFVMEVMRGVKRKGI